MEDFAVGTTETLMTLTFPLKKEMLTAVRLVTGGVCALVGFGIDDAEDCKVCVTEGLLLLSRRGYRNAQVVFEKGERLLVSLFGTERKETSADEAEEEISVALLEALVCKLQMGEERDGYRVSFTFGE